MRACRQLTPAEHWLANLWPLGDFQGESLAQLDRLEDTALEFLRAVGVAPNVTDLQARIQALEDILSAVAIGSAPRGRWLDMFDTAIDGFNDEEVPPPDPNAYWEEYSPEDQRAWLYTVTELCRTALEGGGP